MRVIFDWTTKLIRDGSATETIQPTNDQKRMAYDLAYDIEVNLRDELQGHIQALTFGFEQHGSDRELRWAVGIRLKNSDNQNPMSINRAFHPTELQNRRSIIESLCGDIQNQALRMEVLHQDKASRFNEIRTAARV